MRINFFCYALLFLSLSISQIYSQQGQAFQWAKRIGGSADENPFAVAVDNHKNIITVGDYSGTVDFDPGSGTYNLGGPAIFISKLDSLGNFVWARKVGDLYSTAEDIIVDSIGNIYVVGSFSGTVDFDPGPGFHNSSSTGASDAFILKLDLSGNFIWVKAVGGVGSERMTSVELDSYNNVYVSGTFQDTVDFDPGSGTFNLIANGVTNIFISKLDSSGNFLWAIKNGTSYEQFPCDFKVDALGNAYSLLYNAFTSDELVLRKYDSVGNLSWYYFIVGSSTVQGASLVLDKWGHLYITGSYDGLTNFNTSGSFYLTPTAVDSFNLSSDIFILKMDTSRNFIWVKSIGGSGYESGISICIDNSQNIFVAGWFEETGVFDFDPGSGVYNISGGGIGHYENFLSKFDSSGNFIWVKPIYTGNDNSIRSYIAIDASDHLFMSSAFQAPSLTFAYPTVLNNAGTNTYDIYIGKLGNTTYCTADYVLFPDTTQLHTYSIVSNSIGLEPLTYVWNWGDSILSYGPFPTHTYSDSGFYNICLTIYDSTGGCSDTHCSDYSLARMNQSNWSMVTVNVIGTTNSISAPENNLTNLVSIFPNPASNQITIALGNHKKIEITVADITGKVIYSTITGETTQLELSTKDFAAGIYILQLKSQEFVETKGVIVSR